MQHENWSEKFVKLFHRKRHHAIWQKQERRESLSSANARLPAVRPTCSVPSDAQLARPVRVREPGVFAAGVPQRPLDARGAYGTEHLVRLGALSDLLPQPFLSSSLHLSCFVFAKPSPLGVRPPFFSLLQPISTKDGGKKGVRRRLHARERLHVFL